MDRILFAIVAAPCRAALVHAAALSAELAHQKPDSRYGIAARGSYFEL